jgi:hypothetical protein
MKLACPSCGIKTIELESYGSYDICPLCGWEDDCVQLANPACEGGANKISLIKSQHLALINNVIQNIESGRYERDSKWRPLNLREIQIAEEEKNVKYWKNKAITSPAETYWNENQ